MSTRASSRRVGVTIPLFSLRTARSWGIGEIGDLPDLAAWLKSAGVSLIQLLPVAEMPQGETSPYSALSAFGIDPIYISMSDLEDLPSGPARIADPEGDELERVRQSERVDYGTVRALKSRGLRHSSQRFLVNHLARSTPRARAFVGFVEENKSWLGDLALFRALKDERGGVAWWDWPAGLRNREAASLEGARARLATDILHHQYFQWMAATQWAAARERLQGLGVELMGDLPFVVARDSACVWSRQGEFRDGATVGAPPDPFDDEGQDWGLPPPNWPVQRASGFDWLRRRARASGALFDRFRVDHVVGFYRTFVRNGGGRRDAAGRLAPGGFDPGEEAAQLRQGEEALAAMIEGGRERGAQLVAEDLGVIPPFVRASLARLGVPGYRVLIWEKDGEVYRDPTRFPATSVACLATHDTPSAAAWWEGLGASERAAVMRGSTSLGNRFTEEVHAALLELLFSAGSSLALLLIQDLLGRRERINTPGTVGPANWTYRLRLPLEELARQTEVLRAATRVRDAATRWERLG